MDDRLDTLLAGLEDVRARLDAEERGEQLARREAEEKSVFLYLSLCLFFFWEGRGMVLTEVEIQNRTSFEYPFPGDLYRFERRLARPIDPPALERLPDTFILPTPILNPVDGDSVSRAIRHLILHPSLYPTPIRVSKRPDLPSPQDRRGRMDGHARPTTPRRARGSMNAWGA